MASTAHSAHHAVNRTHNRFGPVAGPPDQRGQATGQRRDRVDRAHQRERQRRIAPRAPAREPEPRSATTTGSSTHGASIIGSVSEEIAPIVVSTRGDSAKAAAAMTREPGDPMPNASASRSSPQNPTVSSSAHHSRWVTQPGRPDDVAEKEEGAVREQVAVRLVLRLAERQLAVPQVQRAGKEPQRVGGQVEFGVRRDLARRLGERQGQRYRRDQPEPAARKRRGASCGRRTRHGSARLTPDRLPAPAAWCPAAPSA